MKTSLILLVVMVMMGGMASASFLGNFAVSPQGTFLLQSANDICSAYNIPGCSMAPTFINLATYGIQAGDTLTITDYGTLCTTAGAGCTQFPASQSYLGAIFSTSNTLTGPSNLNRVSDAIAPGTLTGTSLIGVNTNLNTQTGNMQTGSNVVGVGSIGDDFYVGGGNTVVVPVGATYLIISALDSAFADNSSPAGGPSTLNGGVYNFGVTISDPNAISAVPEPTTYALTMGGIGALLVLLRRRSHSVLK